MVQKPLRTYADVRQLFCLQAYGAEETEEYVQVRDDHSPAGVRVGGVWDGPITQVQGDHAGPQRRAGYGQLL